MSLHWEYKIVQFICGEGTTESCQVLLNCLGGQTWELVSVTEGERYYTAFFKRPP
jgi:IS1 family transposase